MSAAKKRRNARLVTDIARIEKSFFDYEEGDLDQRYHNLERKREHLLRSIILELHLSIEDLLTAAIGDALLQGRSSRSALGQMLRDLLEDEHPIGFRHKVMLARGLGLIAPKEYDDLSDLNTMRNRCSHKWHLGKIIRRKLKPSKPKRPLLRFRGTNLYRTDDFIEFERYFAKLYVRLWMRFE